MTDNTARIVVSQQDAGVRVTTFVGIQQVGWVLLDLASARSFHAALAVAIDMAAKAEPSFTIKIVGESER